VACLAVFLFIIYFLFPETKGRTLEEIAVVFDGDSAQLTSRFDYEKQAFPQKAKSPSKTEIEHVA
jgi:hypothetical protein